MTQIDFQAELALAVGAVRQAAAACTRVQDTLLSAETLEKKDKSPVTIGDFAAQALVGDVLRATSAIPSMTEKKQEAHSMYLRRRSGVAQVRGDMTRRARRHHFGTADPSKTADAGASTPSEHQKGFCDGAIASRCPRRWLGGLAVWVVRGFRDLSRWAESFHAVRERGAFSLHSATRAGPESASTTLPSRPRLVLRVGRGRA